VLEKALTVRVSWTVKKRARLVARPLPFTTDAASLRRGLGFAFGTFVASGVERLLRPSVRRMSSTYGFRCAYFARFTRRHASVYVVSAIARP
jgi:hypothetical protein